jgi:plasmid stabilization system protein ParE
VKIRITPRAERQIREAVTWRDERMGPEAGDELMAEIEATLALVSRHPNIGTRVLNARSPNAQRILLKAMDYFLYYRQDPIHGELQVLALRHTSRGRVPGI